MVRKYLCHVLRPTGALAGWDPQIKQKTMLSLYRCVLRAGKIVRIKKQHLQS